MAIKADATLVEAAFKEGQTKAMGDVPNTKPLFDSAANIQKTYMDTITGVMKTLEEKKEQKEAAKVQGLKPVKETIQKAYNALNDGEPLPEFVVNDFTKQIEALQDSFEKVNTEGKGDTRANEKERRRIMAALARLKNQAIDVRSKYMVAFQDPSNYNDPLIKGGDIDAFNSIATAFSDPTAAAEMVKNGNMRGEFVNGEYTIFTKGYSTTKEKKFTGMIPLDGEFVTQGKEIKYGDEKGFTGSDMVKALPYKNAENDKNFLGYQAPAVNAGKLDGKNGAVNRYRDNPGARNAEIAEALDLIKTDEDYHDMKSRRLEGMDMNASFDKALGGMAEIPIEVLKNMFLDGNGNQVTDMATYFAELDQKGNKDGKINSGDFPEDGDALKTFMNNIETVKEEILNNKEIGAPMMAEYFADMKIKAYNDSYDGNTKTPAHLVKGSIEQITAITGGPAVDYNDPKQFSYLNKSGNIGFLNKSNDGKTYVSGADAKTKLDKIRGAKKGDIITHWEGSNTVRYVKNKYDANWTQEKYNAGKGGFEQEQDNNRLDYGKQMTTEDVEKDMNFPNAMLQTIIEKNGKKYKKVEGGYIEIK